MTPTKRRPLQPLQEFLRTEAGAGVLLMMMVPVALIWANTSDSYEELWATPLTIGLGSADFTLDLRHWINDALMAVFFFVVGLEIKRELTNGQLRDRRVALTPVMAAIGGMAVPALIYFGLNPGGEAASGWAVPMATDIAIVLGLLTLLGKRVSVGLKTFLLTLAIVDDIGAIAVIALFFSEHSLNFVALAAALGCLAAFWALHRAQVQQPVFFVVAALLAWIFTYESGVHATLVGVALALLTPATAQRELSEDDEATLTDVSSVEAATETAVMARQSRSAVEWLQHLFHPWSSYLVLPVFALANAGIALSSESLSALTSSSIAVGVALGLLVGKPLGIFFFTLATTKLTAARLPEGVHLRQVAAASVLGGVGFTVALFVSDLAFDEQVLADDAKAGVLVASLVASVVGLVALHLTSHQKPVTKDGE